MTSAALRNSIEIIEKVPPVLREYRQEVPQEIIYECTTNMQYLRQYYFIREYAYRLDLQLKNFSGVEDEIDQYSHFIIARKGHFCIGGARLTISPVSNRVRLPLEYDEFKIINVLPELQTTNFCELGRTAILPDYRSADILDNIFKLSAEIARKFDCTHMMGVSPPAVARRFKASYQHLGYKTEIREDILPPVAAIHEHLSLKFILVDLLNT